MTVGSSNQVVGIAAAVLDGVADPACLLDDTCTIVAVNTAWRDFGASRGMSPGSPMVGLNYLDVLAEAMVANPADRPLLHGIVDHLRELQTGRRMSFEVSYPCHTPTEPRWFVARASRVVHAGTVWLVMVHHDVTPLTQAQHALRRSETLLQELTAATPGALFRLVQHDDGWHFAFLSPGVETLFGVEARRVRSHAEQLWSTVLTADRDAFDIAFATACERHEPWQHEFRIAYPGGQIKWIQLRAAPKTGERRELQWVGTMSDLSETRRLQAVLRDSEETFRALFETVPQGIVYHAPDGRITAANPAAQRILGLTLAQMQGRRSIDPQWKAMREDGSNFPGDDHPAMVALRSAQPVTGVVMGVSSPERGQVWILVDATPLFKQGRLTEVHVSFEDITERVVLARELRLQASTDFLTGVANRRVLMEHLNAEFARVQRHPDRHCSVLALDLDFFKDINDRHGHAAGDAVLVHLARLMQRESRAIDTVARSGGEEFTLLMPETPAPAALLRAERLREHIAAAITPYEGPPLTVTVSIGVATMSKSDTGIDAVLARADRALYEAKSAGRNSVRAAPDTEGA